MKRERKRERERELATCFNFCKPHAQQHLLSEQRRHKLLPLLCRLDDCDSLPSICLIAAPAAATEATASFTSSSAADRISTDTRAATSNSSSSSTGTHPQRSWLHLWCRASAWHVLLVVLSETACTGVVDVYFSWRFIQRWKSASVGAFVGVEGRGAGEGSQEKGVGSASFSISNSFSTTTL